MWYQGETGLTDVQKPFVDDVMVVWTLWGWISKILILTMCVKYIPLHIFVKGNCST